MKKFVAVITLVLLGLSVFNATPAKSGDKCCKLKKGSWDCPKGEGECWCGFESSPMPPTIPPQN